MTDQPPPPTPSGPAPGWYPLPDRPHLSDYWTGYGWANQPRATGPTPPPPIQAAPAPPAASAPARPSVTIVAAPATNDARDERFAWILALAPGLILFPLTVAVLVFAGDNQGVTWIVALVNGAILAAAAAIQHKRTSQRDGRNSLNWWTVPLFFFGLFAVPFLLYGRRRRLATGIGPVIASTVVAVTVVGVIVTSALVKNDRPANSGFEADSGTPGAQTEPTFEPDATVETARQIAALDCDTLASTVEGASMDDGSSIVYVRDSELVADYRDTLTPDPDGTVPLMTCKGTGVFSDESNLAIETTWILDVDGMVSWRLVPAGAESPDSAAAPDETSDGPVQSDPVATTGMANALRSAETYLEVSGFSRKGLIDQLMAEGYSKADAAYGADNSGADWKEQAVRSAKAYLEVSGFSRSGLIEQLMAEGYKRAEAEYGADGVGL